MKGECELIGEEEDPLLLLRRDDLHVYSIFARPTGCVRSSRSSRDVPQCGWRSHLDRRGYFRKQRWPYDKSTCSACMREFGSKWRYRRTAAKKPSARRVEVGSTGLPYRGRLSDENRIYVATERGRLQLDDGGASFSVPPSASALLPGRRRRAPQPAQYRVGGPSSVYARPNGGVNWSPPRWPGPSRLSHYDPGNASLVYA